MTFKILCQGYLLSLPSNQSLHCSLNMASIIPTLSPQIQVPNGICVRCWIRRPLNIFPALEPFCRWSANLWQIIAWHLLCTTHSYCFCFTSISLFNCPNNFRKEVILLSCFTDEKAVRINCGTKVTQLSPGNLKHISAGCLSPASVTYSQV